jgi:hypothetical protein
MANNHDIYEVADSGGSYTYADQILPDAGRVHYVRASCGTSYIDAAFQPSAPPTNSRVRHYGGLAITARCCG